MKKLNLNIQEIIELYNSGLSCKKIAEQFGCSESYISKRLIGKIQKRNNTYYRRKFSCNHSFFKEIDTEEKAYWLGFMYADGNVKESYNSYYISLGVNDKEVIEKFKYSLGSEHKILIRTRSNGKLFYQLVFASKEMGKDLIKHGCVPNKSLVLKFPNIKENLIRHFIRGYFDGDGCVCSYIKKQKYIYNNKLHYYSYKRLSIQICGTLEFLSVLKDKIKMFNLYKEKRRLTNCYRLDGHNQTHIKSFFNYLYTDATIYLERKYNKFIEFYKKDVQRL